MNWDFLLYFYTTVPVWTFQLPKRAMNLMFWIFVTARKNVERLQKLKPEQPFIIKANYKSVQSWLNLLRLDETDTPKKEIIGPIRAAVAQINTTHDNFVRETMEEINKEKERATTDEQRKEAEEKETFYAAMFARPDFELTTEEPADAKTKDILEKGKVIANINEPYTTKLLKIKRGGNNLLFHNKATRNDEPKDQN